MIAAIGAVLGYGLLTAATVPWALGCGVLWDWAKDWRWRRSVRRETRAVQACRPLAKALPPMPPLPAELASRVPGLAMDLAGAAEGDVFTDELIAAFLNAQADSGDTADN
jgi:hypothetical protein